ncbi:TDT family transporter [Caloramator sp. E03]|uniref:TDT family transporter n=1 Tax=Caloramator sp. E03 TaxID=2576307 RepID=UPI001110A33F|nr:TDT family transporter [Caloramator sp. E03]QCX33117.1 TDT family transporter [Caloramator sp. E03]
MSNIIKKLPIPIAGLMLSLASLGNLLSSYNIMFKNIFGTIAGLILILMIIKLVTNLKVWQKDLENPLIASVTPTFFMALMVLSGYIKPFFPKFAFLIWAVSIIAHIIYILFFTNKFILNFDIKKVLPSYFIVYVGLAAACLSAPAFKMQAVGQIIFWFAFISYLILLPVTLYRTFKYKEFAEPALPSIAIFTAPANLCLAGYLSSFTNKSIFIVSFLGILSFIMFILVILYLPKMLKIKFYPSYSCFTFPFVITAIAMKATNLFLKKSGKAISILPQYIKFLEILSIVIVLYVLVRYLIFLTSKDNTIKVQKTA